MIKNQKLSKKCLNNNKDNHIKKFNNSNKNKIINNIFSNKYAFPFKLFEIFEISYKGILCLFSQNE